MERDQFEREVEKILPQAYRYALRLSSGDTEDASDLIQEASVAAFRGRETFRAGTFFKAWFFKILTNQYYRRGSRHEVQTVALDDSPEPYLYAEAARNGLSTADDPVESVLAKVDQDAILEALDSLPDEYRTVCSMFFVSDMSYEQIAEALDIPVGTVRSRLHRGRKLLQQLLWNLAAERGIKKGVHNE